MKALIISPYFGKLPPWYGLFMVTLARNPLLDWLLITDGPVPRHRPANLLVRQMSLGDFNALCAKQLGFDPAIANPYKVTELKPAFGRIFEESLGGYSHWGYGDCDVLLGDVAAFFPEALLDAYDAFASCRCSITGQFALFRNTPPLREFYRQIPDYPARVRSSSVFNLDELPTDAALSAQGACILRRQLQIHDVDSEEWRQWAERLEREEKGTLDGFFWESGEADWRDGHLLHTATGREAMFYHFHHWKKHWRLPAFPYWPGEVTQISVRQSGLKFAPRSGWKRIEFALSAQVPYWVGRVFSAGRGWAGRIRRGVARRLRRAS